MTRAQAPDLPDALRVTGIMAILLVVIVGAGAFHDLRSVSNISVSENGDWLNQMLFAGVAAIVIGVVAWRGAAPLRALASGPAVLTLAWFVATTVLSTQPLLSARRLLLLLICTGAAVGVFLIARSVRQFALVLAATALLVLAISYAAVIVVPDLAIHSALDLREPEHDGSWRGVFPHKNEAGAAMVIFIFIGLFVARAASAPLGYALVALSALFLACTRAKTPIGLLPLVLVQSWACERWPGTLWRSVSVVAPLAILLLVTVGTIFLPPVKDLVASLAPDPTFTGRTEIWTFAVDNIAKRPLTGFGYGAFWQTEATFFGASDSLSWVNQAGDAHDGYLNTTVEIGIPGLALTVAWLVLEPIANMQRALGGRGLDPAALFFLRCLCFGLLSAVFEGVFYHPTNAGFFVILLAVVGLRFRTRAVMRLC